MVVALVVTVMMLPACGAAGPATSSPGVETTPSVAGDSRPGLTVPHRSETLTGAAVLARRGFSDFSGQRVGLIANRASVVDGRSVVDLMAEADGMELAAIFSPEHGIRADVGSGLAVADGVDPVTGVTVHSLYGATRAPSAEMLTGIDVLVFDLQDVGARFYTYTSTMGLAMQAAAGAGIPFVVLDRPSPLGDRVDGAVRDDDHVSFIGQYPIPSVHGLTTGELARAIRGERWLDGLQALDLRVVELSGWRREDGWDGTGLPWVAPSPGLPSATAALTYPATVLFEATTLSFGRGTDRPFEQFGAPWLDADALADALNRRGLAGVRFEAISFTPQPGPSEPEPLFEGVDVPGVRLVVTEPQRLQPSAVGVHLLDEVLAQAAALATAVTVVDRPDFLDLLAGTDDLRLSLEAGQPAVGIVEAWQGDLAAFEQLRSRYLLY